MNRMDELSIWEMVFAESRCQGHCQQSLELAFLARAMRAESYYKTFRRFSTGRSKARTIFCRGTTISVSHCCGDCDSMKQTNGS